MKTHIAVISLLCSAMVLPGMANATSNLALLQQLSDGYAELAARTKPGVVALATDRVVVRRNNPLFGTPWGGPRFNAPDSTEYRRPGAGSGVIVEHDGEHYILTNNHVIEDAESIHVELTDARHFEAEVVGADTLSDLAVLKIEAEDLPAVPWGRSADLRVGESVIAIGNPFGLEHTVTKGMVSALGRDRFRSSNSRIADYGSFVQTDAAINPGNSGGALINVEGELIGINTAIVSTRGSDPGSKGVGFAIPVDLALSVLGQLIEHGEVRRGLLGAEIRDLTPMMAEALGLKSTNGVFLVTLTPDGPAERAGMRAGDVVLSLDGTVMRTMTQLRSRIGATAPGAEVRLRVLREGKNKTIEVELGELSESVFASAPAQEAQPEETGSLGLRLRDLTSEAAQKYGYEDETGVLISQVRKGSQAARAGLRPGDLIVKVAYEEIETVDDFRKTIEGLESGEAVLFEVRRKGTTNFVPLRIR